ncbi:MAG: N-6 DNA methylase, partial [Rhodospirillales bacterium]|nr:N-6 DNA methylase [Rhodospirillales bacterium]
MSRSAHTSFQTVRSEGGLLPADLLQRVAAGDADLGGLRDADYHASDLPLNERIVRSWNRLVGAWTSFQEARASLPAGDPGTTLTRERFLLPLFEELGYGRLQTARAVEIEGRSYPVSHAWQHVPIHLVGCTIPLDRRTRGVAGAAAYSPHGLVQELLNRSEERLWGFVSNGLLLRVLRDNSSLTRQAYLEFDLEQMLASEAYSDFVLLWLVCHESRLEGERPHECWLERWAQEAVRRGTRALDSMRDGVQSAIEHLGRGFLSQPGNTALREALRSGELSTHDYYRELLRLVYRLLFLFVAEDRDLLLSPGASAEARLRYERWYSTQRLRRLASRRRGTKHADLYEALKLVMAKLGDDRGCPELGLPALGSFLWSPEATPHLAQAALANADLLEAVRALATVREGKVLRAVDYRNLGAEELGSVYESLLELHPELNADAGAFALTTAAGNERKTTGSYYTPTSLISCLLDTALDPVLDEAAGRGEEAILELKVCDPACGSGHFLVAAAHRIAKRLASVRTGDEEPSPEATRHALRDVVSRCLYGVDVNPMAVELCKVSLWLEALDPGRPLSFLDAHIRCGNSLLGTTAALMADGIPDEAFKALAGDDKEAAKALRRQNKQEREGKLSLDDEAIDLITGLAPQVERLEHADDATPEALHAKERLFHDLLASEAYERAKLAADAWCAAFVQRQQTDAPRITTGVVRRLATGTGSVPPEVVNEIRRLAAEYAFFHWEAEYPAVFGRAQGGFDCVLGNPPWETVQLTEKEFFVGHPEIANARNAAARKRLIAALEEDDPPLYAAYLSALRAVEATNHLVREAGRYPLTARGKINTYALFAELMRSLIGRRGRVGCIVPTGIATDATTQYFFRDLMSTSTLVSLFDFRNNPSFFADIASAQGVRFCLLAISGRDARTERALFLFRGSSVSDLQEDGRRFTLAAADIELLNPNTGTCPIFMSARDAELTKAIYRRVPVLVREGDPAGNPWGVSFMQGLFNMASASHLFHAEPADGRVPLYEAKMVHHFNHRFGDYSMYAVKDGVGVRALPEVPDELLADPGYKPQPRWWVSQREVEARLAGRWDRGWLLGWRDITAATPDTFRTVIAAVIPRVAVGHKLPLIFLEHGQATSLLALLSSFPLDYCARQKLGGTSLTYFVMYQLPVLPPAAFAEFAPWDGAQTIDEWLRPRVLELVYTAWDLEPFARDHGYDGPPFRWDPERRALLRAELDAAFFHLYGLERDDVDYVMETFPIVRRRDEQTYGEYRTKRLILELYDELAEAIATGRPYQTRLDPPPA